METLTRWMTTEDIAAINRAGAHFTEEAHNIILAAERANFRSDADADQYGMNHLANLVNAAKAFAERIVVEHTKANGHGVAILRSKDGERYVVRTFQAFTNDGRIWGPVTYAATEAEARAKANEAWASL